MRPVLIPLLFGLTLTPALAQTTQYVTTQYVTTESIKVMMRTGTSLNNKILREMGSGDVVTVIEDNLASDWSQVELEDGTRGYVLSRFLSEVPVARQQLNELRTRYAEQEEQIARQGEEIGQLQSSLAQERSDNDALKTTLRSSEQELSDVRGAAENTLAILEQNKQLQTTLNELQIERTRLTEENLELKDSTRLDWFVRGGAVSLIAFVIGILVTRIRWRKRDSWGGSY